MSEMRVSDTCDLLISRVCVTETPDARQAMGVISTSSSGRMTLEDILLPGGALQADDAFSFQLPHHGDDLLLGALHLLDLDGAQGIHIFAQHFGSSLAHGLQ